MAVDLKSKKVVITVGREFGSGGRMIGRLISDKLDLPLYDKDLINRAAAESGIDEDAFNIVDEKHTASILFSIVRNFEKKGNKRLDYGDTGIMSMNERLYLIQKQVIKKIASEGSCVIMGRCSNVTLKDDPDAVHFFIKAPKDFKLKTLKEVRDLEPKAAEKLIKETDKDRANYYKYYTGLKWGDTKDYEYILDSSVLGIEATADIICEIALKKAGIK